MGSPIRTKFGVLMGDEDCACCPNWRNHCCPYRVCGLPTRLILSTSEGSIALVTSNGDTWTGTLHITYLGAVTFTLTCNALDDWTLTLGNLQGCESLTEYPLAMTCDPLALTFLFTDVPAAEFAPTETLDITAAIIEEPNPPCNSCCCIGQVALTGDAEFVDIGSDDGFNCLSHAFDPEDFPFGPVFNCVGIADLCMATTTITIAEPPIGENPLHLSLTLSNEVTTNGRCKLVLKGIASAELPGLYHDPWLYAVWEKELTREACVEGGTHSLELLYSDPRGSCEPPELINILVNNA